MRVVQLDLARQMETVSFVKEFVDKVADAGYDTLLLYLEGRVATKTFSLPPGESYTPDEMREVVAHASKRGVDVVPCVSVLGHAEHFFRVSGHDHLSEERTGECRWKASEKQTFCATSAEARAFLEAYLAEIADIFPGRNFHAGLDESFQFGFCPTCRARREEIGFGALFTEHVTWARGVLAKLGKRMWMWDDMYEFFPEELENVPRDIVMCMWIYDNDVTEWGHRGHFLNRIRVDWLAEYERLGMDVIPVGAACRDNLRTLADYAARHKTLGFFVSQWEMSDSFFGVPMATLVGVERAYPTLTAVQRCAVEALAAKWSYFGRGSGVEMSRSRHKGRLAADRNVEENERASTRLAVEVLKGCASHPGEGPVPRDPLSEAALVDDIVTHFEHLLFWHDLDEIAPHLISPRRTAEESRAAKARLRALLPEMERVAARKEAQQAAWRPGMHTPKGGLAGPVRDHIAFVGTLLSQPDVAASDDWMLGLSLSLPDYHGIPKWTVSGLFDGEWRVLAQGTYKPARGDWANFERAIPFKSPAAPTALRVAMDGYGEGMLLFAHVWNRERRLVPDKLLSSSGIVQNPEYALRDDYMPARFGRADRRAVFLNPELSADGGSIEFSLR